MIVVIDYGMGNLRSIEKALNKINAEFIISNKKEDIESATHLILPGVGFFKEGMDNLKKLNLIETLKKQVLINKKPFLGICLGMQLLFNSSEEGGLVFGLGFINGEVKRFNADNDIKIPHMGWNNVYGQDFAKIQIFNEIKEDSNFYFIHSYHPILNEKIDRVFTNYGYDFVSAIQKENIFATQFHPEKSQKKGLQLLKNFISLNQNVKN